MKRLALVLALCALAAPALVHAKPRTARVAAAARPSPDFEDNERVIEAVLAQMPQLPRDRRASMALVLQRLGPSAMPSLMSRLTQDTASMTALRESDPSAAMAFDAALVEALGTLRNRVALPVIVRTFERPDADRRLMRAAADALGRLCDQGGFSTLSTHATKHTPRGIAALSGLGLCRNERATRLLANRLESAADDEELHAASDGLSFAGSSWAWQALGRPAEGAVIRKVAANALAAALDRKPSTANRETLVKALMMVDEPRSRPYVTGAR